MSISHHTITAHRRDEIVKDLEQAFAELSACGGNSIKMAEAIGGARCHISYALAKLGEPAAMREIDAALKAWHDSVSNSTAPIGPRAVKESAPVRPIGVRGVSLATAYVGASAPDLSNEIGYDG